MRAYENSSVSTLPVKTIPSLPNNSCQSSTSSKWHRNAIQAVVWMGVNGPGTTSMSGNQFIDTNVLAYVFDNQSPTSIIHQLSYWDSLIIEAAAAAGCTTLLTDDLTDGQIIRGVRVTNPF